MDFDELYAIENEIEQIQKTYELFDEAHRLNRSKAARVEFLTTVRYIERYLTPSAKILDIGAGAGEYSLYFAQKGYDVCALELSPANIAAFREKLTPELPVELAVMAVEAFVYTSFSKDERWQITHPVILSVSANLIAWFAGILLQ